MIGKAWKKILFLVLIIACIFNIMIKIINKNSLKSELEATLKNFGKDKTSQNIINEIN